MVPNSFGNRSFMRPMGSLSLHSKCLFYSFNFVGGREGGWGGKYHANGSIIPLFQQVPNVFPMGVPNCTLL
jgi:hypothetical protein